MNVYKEMYLQLFNKVSDIIEELQDVQTLVENIYANAKQDSPDGITLPVKKKSKVKSAIDELSVALVDNGIDEEDFFGLERILRQKKDELGK